MKLLWRPAEHRQITSQCGKYWIGPMPDKGQECCQYMLIELKNWRNVSGPVRTQRAAKAIAQAWQK